jgi:hypothetical protein
MDNDGIKEIFPASGVGYKKGNDTYYYKFMNGKYRLQFYHSGWLGEVHKIKPYMNYIPFVDEKNGVNVFLPIVIPEQMNECELTIEFSPIVTSFCISTNGPIFTLLPITQPYKLTGSTIDTFSPSLIFLIPDILLFYF